MNSSIESREVRHALTDTSYIGCEREGIPDIHIIGSGPFEVVFLEDNQATIRIMETGKSPSFRHTDKTQRLSLAWLSEQFRRKHFNLVYVASMLQAADILTKPFTSPEKWVNARKLLRIVESPPAGTEQVKGDGKPAPAAAGGKSEPTAQCVVCDGKAVLVNGKAPFLRCKRWP